MCQKWQQLLPEREVIRDLEIDLTDYWQGRGVSPLSVNTFYAMVGVNPDSPSAVLRDLIEQSAALGRKIEPTERVSLDDLLAQMEPKAKKKGR